MIWITGFPLSPSVNQCYMPIAGKATYNRRGKAYSKGRLIKTDTYRAFESEALLWQLQNQLDIDRISEKLLKLKNKTELEGRPFALRMDMYFVFHVERLLTVNNKVERLDEDNRVKPCRDVLSTILRIDDKHIFGGHCEKVTTHSKESECSIIRISPMRPRSLAEIKDLILLETNTATKSPP